jgi:hypothetical protein
LFSVDINLACAIQAFECSALLHEFVVDVFIDAGETKCMPAIKKGYKHIPVEVFVVFVIAASLADDDLRPVDVDVVAAVYLGWFWLFLLLLEFKEGGVVLLH